MVPRTGIAVAFVDRTVEIFQVHASTSPGLSAQSFNPFAGVIIPAVREPGVDNGGGSGCAESSHILCLGGLSDMVSYASGFRRSEGAVANLIEIDAY